MVHEKQAAAKQATSPEKNTQRGKSPEHGKTIAIHTPIGMLTAEACGSEQSYPGIQISLTTDGYSGKELVACAEYNADDEELRTECYAKGVDEPTSIIRNRDGVDILR